MHRFAKHGAHMKKSDYFHYTIDKAKYDSLFRCRTQS